MERFLTSDLISLNPKDLDENYIKLIADKWMLITAGDKDKFNTMTANWGGVGYLWNKPVVFIFIRPQRYTFEFVEAKKDFTLTFFEEDYRPALNLCGKVSGRDRDKVKESELNPVMLETGNIVFKEASLMIECKKLYADFLKPEAFLDKDMPGRFYPEQDFHKVYIGEILNIYENKNE